MNASVGTGAAWQDGRGPLWSSVIAKMALTFIKILVGFLEYICYSIDTYIGASTLYSLFLPCEIYMSLEGMQLGNYKLLRLVGSGGMGEVYLAEDVRIARQVAIKVVKTEPSSYPDEESVKAATRLFQREMRAIVSLPSTHILPMHDFGTETANNIELTYMVMPYLAEGSLKDWLRQHSTSNSLSPQDIAHIVDQAAYALQDAHDNNIIHQDIKPQNFLIRTRRDTPNRPDVFLADFGIAKFTSATSTASQHVRGTPAYMPPEQWESNPVPASDQYALAIMAYELLTWHLPFQGRMEQVMRQHLMVQPPPPSTYNPQISPALDTVILCALAKKPEERFPSISDFSRAFQQATAYTDLRATLTLTSQEGALGSNHIMKLPGMRQVTVNVPASTQNGQIIRIEGAGEAYYENGPRGPLVLTVAINDTDQFTGPIITIPNTLHNQQPTRPEQNVTTLSSTMPSGFSAHLPASLNQPTQETKLPLPIVGPPPQPPQFPPRKKRLTRRTLVLASILLLSNLAFEVQMTIIKGDCGGITFRVNPSNGQLYRFGVCQDGSYTLLKYIDDNDNNASTLAGGSVSSNKASTLAVVANGSDIELYVNKSKVDSAHDSSYNSGAIGLFAEDIAGPTDAAFSNARVWALS